MSPTKLFSIYYCILHSSKKEREGYAEEERQSASQRQSEESKEKERLRNIPWIIM